MSHTARFAWIEARRARARRRPSRTLAALLLGGAVALAGQLWASGALAQDADADAGSDEPAMPSFTPNGGAAADAAQTDAAADEPAATDDAEAGGFTPHVWGDPDAPVEVLEFSSYTCGHCAAFHTRTLPTLKEQYIETGKVRLVLIDFPLDNVAAAVSMVTHCAPPDIGKKLVDIFFADQDAWMTRTPVDSISGMVRLAGMSEADVEACLQNDALYEAILDQREAAAEQWAITGTPTFVIAGERHTGSYRLEEMTAALDAALARAEADADADADADPAAPTAADSPPAD